MSGRVGFTCNRASVSVEVADGETLLDVLRERLGITSVKDGCAPQGQCGCCTVLVDGEPRVACVTPAGRVARRDVTTLEGLDPAVRDDLTARFVATGGSQCGFCTPGILVRAAALRARGRTAPVDLDRALAAHLCRCTGWRTIYDALGAPSVPAAVSVPAAPASRSRRDTERAARRATLEGGSPQQVGPAVPLGAAGFADDTAPREALVAVPLPPGAGAPSVEAAGLCWVVGGSVREARAVAGKVQGRHSTTGGGTPLPLLARPEGGVRLATSWVEPAYLEPDASWCEPGGEPVSPLVNGGAFGGKVESLAPRAARELADRMGRAVRVVYSREDVVRLGPKRPPVSGRAVLRGDGSLAVEALCAGDARVDDSAALEYLGVSSNLRLRAVEVVGPPTSRELRVALLAELRVLQEGALDEAGFDRAAHLRDDLAASVLLDNAVSLHPERSKAGARVHVDPSTGTITDVEVRVAAGDPLDDVVLRSYATGAVHMALGWVLTEGIAVDPDTGEVHDLTIRSFGVIRPRATPPIEVTVVDDPRPALARGSDAVFVAVAASCWNAIARADGMRPETFPARGTRAARMLRR